MEDNSLLLQQYLSSILDREEIKLFLHAEVVESQIDAALGVGDDQPHAVHVVAVLLGVVGRQQHPGWSGEVEEARNCRSQEEKKKKMGLGENFAWVMCFNLLSVQFSIKATSCFTSAGGNHASRTQKSV